MPESTLMPAVLPQAAGWYGKIPALGDFASRRLTQQFIETMDDWLQRSLSESREQLGSDWLACYLNSPIWRFVLLPGLCGNTCWAGVMMPSIDQVGRHFPLLIAAPFDAGPASLCRLVAANEWFDGLEQAALACLDLAASVDALEARLAQLAAPVTDAGTEPARRAGAALASWWRDPGDAAFASTLAVRDCTAVVESAGSCLLGEVGSGRSLWWHCDPPNDTMRLHAFRGLPPPSTHVALLATIVPGQAAALPGAVPA